MVRASRQLPSGTVTLLFSDIENSTRLLANLRDAYQDLLATYRRSLRTAVDGFGGQEVDAEGDGLFFAFPRARTAIDAAVAAQRTLAEHQWPGGAIVRIRMGIHTGEPLVAEEGFVGLAVHRAARLCAAGHGGQVLLSHATCQLIEDALPPEVTLLDLGEHTLRGLDRPERVFQLAVPGLPDTFPPLRSEPARRKRRAAQLGIGVIALGLSWRHRSRLTFLEAREMAKRPSVVGSAGGFVLGGIVIEPWVAAGAVVVCAWVALEALRGMRVYYGLEDTGFRIHAMSRVASEESLSGDVSALGAGAVRAARLATLVDRLLATIDEKELARRLEAQRVSFAPLPLVLHEADVLARKLRSIARLAERRNALDRVSERLAEQTEELDQRLFDARIEPSLCPAIADEIAELLDAIEAAASALQEAYDEVRRLHSSEERLRRLRLSEM
jgi:class 3 adenylate cyclase